MGLFLLYVLSSVVCNTGKAWLPGHPLRYCLSWADSAVLGSLQTAAAGLAAFVGKGDAWFSKARAWHQQKPGMGRQSSVLNGSVPTAAQNQSLPEHNYLLTLRCSLHWFCASQPFTEKGSLTAFISLDQQILALPVDLPVFRKLTTSQELQSFSGGFCHTNEFSCCKLLFAFLWQVFWSAVHTARSCFLMSACKS